MYSVYIYLSPESYSEERPEIEINRIRSVQDDGTVITLLDDDGFTHRINMSKIFSYTYKMN